MSRFFSSLKEHKFRFPEVFLFILGALIPTIYEFSRRLTHNIPQDFNSNPQLYVALEESYRFLMFSMSLVVITFGMLIVTLIQMWQLSTSEDLSNDAQEDIGRRIAIQFQRLETDHSQFNATILNTIYRLKSSDNPISSEDATRLRDALKFSSIQILEKICNTAVYVIASHNRSSEERFSSNIKYITIKNDDKFYSFLARSESGREFRKLVDQELVQEPKKVITNYSYNYIALPNTPNYWVTGDIRGIIKKIEDLETIKFDEPSTRSVGFYKSCLVVPIIGPSMDLYEKDQSGQNEGFISLGSDVILGFMCVDSDEVGAFSDTHDSYELHIMKQMAAQAFNVISAFNGAMGLISRQ